MTIRADYIESGKNEALERVKQEMCDSFCRVPYEAIDQEEADELCKLCPLEKLRGYAYD